MSRLLIPLTIAVVQTCVGSVFAQMDFEHEPINYSKTKPTDRISKLVAKLDSGSIELKHDDAHGYLQSLLNHLEIPVSSQTLVFSKTSFQRHRISRKTPRALYFNDDVYVGWVQHGDMIELSTADPKLGAIFYTLDQSTDEPPKFQRQTDHCMICHASTHTRRVPGHIMRSVYTDRSGMPVFASGTFRTDHKSPFDERWGGWFVTGTHGSQRHMGNEFVASKLEPDKLDVESGANVTSLADRIDTSPYLGEHSDVVALMVLAHQVALHNAITTANYSARRTIRDAEVMNKALDREDGFESESAKRRFTSAANQLVEWLLMVDETELTGPVAGTSGFAKEFEAMGPFDKSGRSLRQLDLKRRMFKYPCSFLIYSEAFDAIPDRLRNEVYQRMWDILTGKDTSEEFEHLSEKDRLAIRSILIETKTGLPDFWVSDTESKQLTE